ncbi:hypothetical protein P261_01678 [Lachnospiraceae bacterium TWA4]|nr:hypothetical protein P261_01678 [Lachnospiraceae bacterium TWA4]
MDDKIQVGIRFHDRMGNYYKIVQVAYAIGTREPLYLCQELNEAYELTVWQDDDLKVCLKAEKLYSEDETSLKRKNSYEKAKAAVEGETFEKEKTFMEYLGFGEKDRGPGSPQSIQKKLMAFLDADSYVIKMEILADLRGKIDEAMLENLAVSLDYDLGNGSLEEKYYSLVRYLQAKIRYEQPRRL